MKIYSHGTRHLIAVDCIIFGYDLVEKEIKRNVDRGSGARVISGILIMIWQSRIAFAGA
jgi:hypothetical protein